MLFTNSTKFFCPNFRLQCAFKFIVNPYEMTLGLHGGVSFTELALHEGSAPNLVCDPTA